MPRLIDADALLERESATRFSVGGRGCGKTLLAACRNYLHTAVANAPTIDAVPVVRCKDCKLFIPAENLTDEYDNPIGADGLCDNMVKYADYDGFCSYGERRSDD